MKKNIMDLFSVVFSTLTLLVLMSCGGGPDEDSPPPVVEGANSPPVANFTYQIDGNSISFDASSSSDPDQDALTYSWSFSLGGTSTIANPTLNYDPNAEMRAELTVSDGQASANKVEIINVQLDPDEELGDATNGKALFESSQYGCASCHGLDGQSEAFKPINAELKFYTHSSQPNQSLNLTDYINTWMPDGPTICDMQCARDIAAYIRSWVGIVVGPEPGVSSVEELFSAQCARCHDDDGSGVTDFGPALNIGYQLDEMIEKVRNMPPPDGSGLSCGTIANCEENLAQYIIDSFARSNSAPFAGITVDDPDYQNQVNPNITGTLPYRVVFTSGSTDDYGVDQYDWRRDGESVAETESTTMIFDQEGTYNVLLSVKDEEGLTSTASLTVTVVRSAQNQAPEAQIQLLSDPVALTPHTVSVSSSASADDNGITRVEWDIDGDGQPDSTSNDANFTFNNPGTTTIALTVFDAEGLSSRVTTDITTYDSATFGAERYVAEFTGCARCHGDSGQGGVGDPLTGVWDYDALLTPVTRMVRTKGTNCLSVAEDSCASAIRDYVFENFANTITDGDSAFACPVNSDEPAEGIDIKRLSYIEYYNTVYDILDTRLGTAEANQIINDSENGVERLVPIDSHISGFRQMDSKVALDYVEGWFLFSVQMVDAIMPDITTFVDRSCASDPDDNACMRDVIETVGLDILRRPLTPEQVDFYASSDDYRELLIRMFNSPEFIYHLEIDGSNVSGRTDLMELTPYELASRLSYTFWQSKPDAQLMDDADSGAIVNDFDIVMNRVLNSSKTRTGVKSFFEDWWETEHILLPSEVATRGLRLVDQDPDSSRDTSLPVDFSPEEYREAAIEEVLDLTDYVTWESDGKLSTLFTDTHSFARSPLLAKAYGVPVWDGNYSNLVDLPTEQRSGLLTRAAFHIYGGSHSNPILKGAHIRKRILCDEIPLPADNTPPEVNPDPNWTTRDLVIAQTESTSGCRECHLNSINPPGFATEDYDVLGRFRESEKEASVSLIDPNGGEVDGNVIVQIDRDVPINAVVMPRILGDDDDRQTNSGVDFSQEFSSSPKIGQCFAKSYFKHTFSREEDIVNDGCMLRNIEEAAKTGSLKDAIRSIAERPEFKLRKIKE